MGVGTVYRHFPTRADLVTAVYRHQVDECVALAETLNADDVPPPTDALCRWTSAFTYFLVTKHGLSDALSSDDPSLNNLHALIFDSLVPAFASLVERAQDTGAVSKDVSAVTFLRASPTCASSDPAIPKRTQRRWWACCSRVRVPRPANR
ncbi:TetR/AcrR family transcriptional regulator [Gordonia westfalica]|uniref:Transcriptional regulator SbtR-like C-terminal domain-containing protein n=1 Tax=Gordonia westfalica TaxID=158898 RepID=A0A1H2LDB9_9ACTN|nr:TetR/AcrR family transcriptional regulator [Gordonia westfalica]SDU78628.1 hypothetical protein SAMN04488548_13653 [Gordonia westfalica]